GMDMHSREQYLATLRKEYLRGNKKQKTRLLNEARKRTKLNRKVLIRKLTRMPAAASKPKRRRRGSSYGVEVKGPLTQVWEWFDFPCGQRLAPILREQVKGLRQSGELKCSDEVAGLLERISPKTIDRLLAREREIRCLKRQRNPPVHPLLYQRVPVKVAIEWDRQEVGNVQLDYVLHCGRSTAGEYLLTLSATDIATGWWEGAPQLGRSQKATQASLAAIRERFPFRLLEVHPDNDSGILNDLLWNYCRRHRIRMSRSRPYQKNDNAWVEQKNWTHVRKVVGYRRLTTAGQCEILRELYRASADFRNFFQPVMKLKEKRRVGGKVRRVYEEPRTPYKRLLQLGQLKPKQRQALEQRYHSLNPAQLRRHIEQLRTQLFDLVERQGEAAPPRHRRHGPSLDLHRAPKKRATAGD
ncbi:MAG: hypothetical protein ACRD7E_13775, partial [Bryobacteraceae bacterium]